MIGVSFKDITGRFHVRYDPPQMLKEISMKIKTLFRILLTPSCWLRNHKTDNVISAFINNALE